jgi:hypothetical protein
MAKISSNERFTCIKIRDKIIIYSIELHIPIASLDINNGIFFSFLYSFLDSSSLNNYHYLLLRYSNI